MTTLESLDFRSLARAAVDDGLEAAAVFDVDGKALAVAGALDTIERRAITAVISNFMRSADPLTRMLAGDWIEVELHERMTSIGIAARCVFVVVVPQLQLPADNFRSHVERMIGDARADFSGYRAGPVGSGGSSSGPAELPVVEWTITIPRKP
jgi:hypothetical protein